MTHFINSRETIVTEAIEGLVASSGGYFHAIAQRGARLVDPSRRWRPTSSTLITTPSIS